MVNNKFQAGVSKIYLGLMMLLLYTPIFVLVISSFNASPRNKAKWGGFSLKGYRDLLGNDTMMQALGTTLLLAFGAALVATVLGTLVCIGMMGMKKSTRTLILGITNIPLLNADIVTGIALMLLFSRFLELSFWTMLIAHVTLIIPYVVLSVQPKVAQLNASTYEAALDLGASPVYAFCKVVLPDLLPGIFAGFLLAFTMSLDDFSVTYFTKAPGIETMSTMINAEYRKGIQTEIYALSTIVFFVVLLVLLLMNHQGEAPRRKEVGKDSGNSAQRSRMISDLQEGGSHEKRI